MTMTLMVLFPDLRGEPNSAVTGAVYMSFTNFISDACLTIPSRISILYGLSLVRKSSTELMNSLSRSSSDRCTLWSSFYVVFSVFTMFGCNVWTEAFKSLLVGTWDKSSVFKWSCGWTGLLYVVEEVVAHLVSSWIFLLHAYLLTRVVILNSVEFNNFYYYVRLRRF